MIKVSQVSKKYGSRSAITDLNFEVKKGEVVGLLGPNGAGKTTTMKIITGYMAPTSGNVYIDDKDIFENPIQSKKKIGYLPEVPPVYEDMYVTDYLYYVARLKDSPKNELTAIVNAAIEKAGLKEVSHRLIHNLSKGFKQRTGLAQALIAEPEILILDEPTVGLDPNQVIEIRNLIGQLRGKHTIILSTHILSEVQASCDRIIIIDQGKMVAEESIASLRDKQSQGRRKVTVRVQQHSEQLIELLNALDGITQVEYTSPLVLSLSINQGTSVRMNEGIAKVIIQSGAGLVELNQSFSLEDVFLKLTEKEKES